MGAAGLRAEEIGFHFLERVGDLGERGDTRAGAVVAEIKRDGIEEIAEDARERDEHDATAGEIDAVGGEVSEDAGL